jgi:pimeloyl-ACP methyl ester carboxylesterase
MKGQQYSNGSYKAHCQSLKYLSIKSQKLAYLDIGEGPVFLLLHGVPTSSWLYRNMIPPMVEAGYRVVVPDMMGFGQSSKPEEDEMLNFAAQGRCLQELVDHLSIQKLTLCVHDAGGPWAWQWLGQSNINIESLILLNTILYMEGFNPPINWRRKSLGNNLLSWAYKSAILGKSIVRSTLRNGVGRYKYSWLEKEGYTSPMSHQAGRAMGLFMGSFDKLSSITSHGRQALIERNVPICTIWGEDDPFLIGQKQLPLALNELNLSQKNLNVLPGCRHFIQDEMPDEIVRIMLNFIKKVGEQ